MTDIQQKGHSEEYFHEERNHWYNPDFLELMARRWQLQQYHSLLDIGAGLCHWSKLLAPHLASGARITALDNDPKWAAGNPTIADQFDRLGVKVDFQAGTAYELPFPDDSFDVVTCQTLLIHLHRPEKALAEMKRVVKKGGVVICAEPNNRVQAIIQDSSNHDDPVDKVLNRLRQTLVEERLKKQRSEGNSSFGDLLSGTMNTLGFQHIQSFLNDKLISIYPPYASMEQQAAINVYLTWGQTDSEKSIFNKKYNRALSGKGYLQFLREYKPLLSYDKILEGLKNQTYTSGGASLMYLVSGKK